MYEKLLKKSGSPFKPPKEIRFQPDPDHKNQWWAWTKGNKDRRIGTEKNAQITAKHAHFGVDARKAPRSDKYFLRGEYSFLGKFAVKRAKGDLSKVESYSDFKKRTTKRFS